MKLTNFRHRISRFKWRGLKTITQDQDGVSAVEFAIIAPLLVTMYFGGVELSLLMQADRRITTATATIGDLASRTTVLNSGDIADIFAAGDQLLFPLDAELAEVRLSSLVADPDGIVTVAWSDACGIAHRETGSSVDNLPAGIVPDSGSVILAEVSYDYASNIDFLPAAKKRLSDQFYLRPRRSDTVERDRSLDGGSLPSGCTSSDEEDD